MHQPLLYGMYKHDDLAEQKSYPPTICNIDETNKARKKLGLSSLTEYLLADSSATH